MAFQKLQYMAVQKLQYMAVQKLLGYGIRQPCKEAFASGRPRLKSLPTYVNADVPKCGCLYPSGRATLPRQGIRPLDQPL